MTARKSQVTVNDKMDSAEDAYKQCEAGPSNRILSNEHQFCEQPFCLGTLWHEWGCCSLDCELSSEPSRYAFPKMDEEIKRAREESVPKTTRTDTTCCIRLRNDWAENRNKHTKEMVPPFDQLHDKSSSALADSIHIGSKI